MKLLNGGSVIERAMAFTALTGVRTKPVRYLTWNQIDLNRRIWTMPRKLTKCLKHDFSVPLSDAAMAILESMQRHRQDALARVIEPTGGPGAELATLEDAARFVGLMRPWRQARPHWHFAAELLLKAAETREESHIEMATAQMERALRVDGWLCP